MTAGLRKWLKGFFQCKLGIPSRCPTEERVVLHKAPEGSQGHDVFECTTYCLKCKKPLYGGVYWDEELTTFTGGFFGNSAEETSFRHPVLSMEELREKAKTR